MSSTEFAQRAFRVSSAKQDSSAQGSQHTRWLLVGIRNGTGRWGKTLRSSYMLERFGCQYTAWGHLTAHGQRLDRDRLRSEKTPVRGPWSRPLH
jgi:hypothetical protein